MPEVIVVGGGVIGCATAYYLARDGIDVAVMERDEVASGASSAAAGILASLSTHGDHPAFYDRLCEDSLELFDGLLPVLQETGIDVRHRSIGMLEVAVTQDDVSGLKRQYEQQREKTTWLDGDEAQRLEPGLSPETLAAILTPNIRYLDPQRLTQAFAAAARKAGATIREHEPVTRFLRRGNRLRGVQTSRQTYEADAIVIAGGPWSTALANKLGANIPVRPVRGQMLSLDGPAVELTHLIHGYRAFALPREDNQTYVGATVEEAGYRKRTTVAGLATLRHEAEVLIPSLAKAKQRRAWAGLRPGTPDNLPILGRLPNWQNAWVSSGHFRTGILLSPITAKLMAQAITKDSEGVLPPELSPSRFA